MEEIFMGCLFCDIISGKTPSHKVFENDKVYAFKDISPQAPLHVLVVHKEHIKNIDELTEKNSYIINDIFLAIKKIAEQEKLDKGYRVIINNGVAAGQVIWHLHIHILAGKDDLGPMLVQ